MAVVSLRSPASTDPVTAAPTWRVAALGLACAVALGVGGLFMPKWLTFLITMAAANGLVSLGIVILMRGGVVAFGQGMVFAVGGYTAALAFNKLGLTDALGLALAGGVAAMLVAAPFAPLLSRYRGIFFAMLTLALSMVTYGLFMKLEVLGGSDGFNIGRPTLLGQALPDARVGYIVYVLAVVISTLLGSLTRIYFDSTRGLITLAVRENELRVEYLGGSVRQAMAINFILAAFAGGWAARWRCWRWATSTRTSATGPRPASSSSWPSWQAGRASPRSSWPARCWKWCARFPARTFPTPGSSRSGCSCCS